MKRRWRKSWEEKWRDEASDTLGLAAKALRAFLGDVADLEDGSDVGWAVDGNGRAYTRPRFARVLSATEAQIEEALEQLLAAGIVVEADGRIGLLGYRTTQEDPSAKRVREHRAKAGNAPMRALPPGRDDPDATPPVTVTPDVTPVSTPGNDQKTEDRRQKTDPNSSGDPRARACEEPVKNALSKSSTLGGRISLTRVQLGLAVAKVAERTGIPATTIRRIEADDAVPTRSELERLSKALGDPELASVDLPARDEGVVRDVAGRLHDARAGLGAAEPRRPVDGDLVREVFAPLELVPTGMSLGEAWALVIPRAAEQARRNAEDGRPGRDLEFLTLAWLGKPERFRRFLANSALDQRREQPKPRGSPARQTGPRNHELRPIVRRDEGSEET